MKLSKWSSMSGSVRRGLAVCSAALAFSATLALAQEGGKAAPKKMDEGFKGGTVFVLERASLDRLFNDPKDKKFGDALAMIPLRLKDLPNEIPQMPPEALDMIQTMLSVAAKPMRITVAYDESPTGGFFGYGLAFSALTGDKGEADKIQTQITDMLDMAGNVPRTKPSTRFKGMLDMQTPVGIISFGPRQAKDGWRYELVVGTMTDADIGVEALPKPAKGLDVFARGRFDLAGLTPAADTAQAFAGMGPEMQEIRGYLTELGLIGSNAMKISFQAGRTETESVSITAVENVGHVADTLGISRAPLDRALLAAIPSDAGHASMSRMGMAWVNKVIDRAKDKSEDVGQVLAQFKAMTKVDFQQEIIDSLGDVNGFYTSESTGGGGLGSAVLMMSLKDREKFAGAIDKLATFINGMSKQHARGYVRVASNGNKDGVTWYTLQFPGLPVPLELSMALTDKWLLMAPTPQALTVAVSQARGKGDGGLTSNAVFAGAFPKDGQYSSISFTDSAKSIGSGYMLLSMIGSAVSNVVRSPSDPGRDAGMVVPLFNDLKKGARPTIGFAQWQGDNYVMESHSDHSILVNAAVGLGNLAGSLPMMAMQVMSAMGQARGMRMEGPAMLPSRMREAGEQILSGANAGGDALQWLYRQSLPVFSTERMVSGAAAAMGAWGHE